jgi:hypothetical protein
MLRVQPFAWHSRYFISPVRTAKTGLLAWRSEKT